MAIEPNLLAFFQNIGTTELIIIAILALLFFGRRLPEVGRSLGKGIVEFKKGLKDTGDEITKIDEPGPSPTKTESRPADASAEAVKPKDYKLT